MEYAPPVTLVRAQQIEAWGYYGAYGVNQAASQVPRQAGSNAPGCRSTEAVGEVRYIVGWAADQMSRMQWDVFVDGSADWELELPDGTTIASDGDKGDNSHAKASISE